MTGPLLTSMKPWRSTQEYQGVTPVMIVAQNGHANVVKILLSKGANVNTRSGADNKDPILNGTTALIAASSTGHTEIVMLLLDKGANVDACLDNGRTSLMVASFMGHDAVVNILKQRGADVSIRDKSGATASDYAEAHGYLRLASKHDKNGEYDKAIAEYSKAIKLNPKNEVAYKNRGGVYFQKNDKKNGCADFRHACNLGDCQNYRRSQERAYCR